VFFATDTLFAVKFIIEDMIIRDDDPDTFSLRISNVLILNSQEQVIELGNIIADSVVIVSAKTPNRHSQSIALAPNPVRETLIIASSDAPMEKIEIHSLAGERVRSMEANGQHRVEMSVASLPPGVWLAVVQTRSGMAVKKFVKTE
jgi:hypothetical protein